MPGTPQDSTDLKPPRRVGRYRLLAPIARGGAATVYLARSQGIGGFSRIVAVKVLHPHLLEDDASTAAREFIEEAKLSARLRHPMIVPVMDVGQADEGFFLVMEYVDGPSLSEILRHTPRLPDSICLRILFDVLQGLHAAHTATDDRGQPLAIVHRDYSPQNILVGADGRSRLTDFGIARATTRAEFTRTGMVRGKIAYMSPEQGLGKPLDARTDVWAAGVVAWEMFAGRRMFPGMDPMPMLLRITSEDPPRLRNIEPEVPEALDRAIHRALVRNIHTRCPSALVLRDSIVDALGGPGAMASNEEVAEYIAGLDIERLRQLREIVQEASESRSLPAQPEPSRPSQNDIRTLTEATVAESTSTTSAVATDSQIVAPAAAVTSATRFATALRPLTSGKIPRTMTAWAGITIAALVVLGLTSEGTQGSAERAGFDGAGSEIAVPPPVHQETSAPPPEDRIGTERNEPDVDVDTSRGHEATVEPVTLAPRTEVSVTADEPISIVRVDERVIALAAPSAVVSLQLRKTEQDRDLKIEAITSDGRRASTTVTSEETTVALDFPERPRVRVRKSSALPKKKTTDLAASPY